MQNITELVIEKSQQKGLGELVLRWSKEGSSYHFDRLMNRK